MRTVSGALGGALLAAALLAGCTRAPAPTPTVLPTQAPTATALASATPTSTALPSATPAPTLTPTPALRALAASAALAAEGQGIKSLAFAPAGATRADTKVRYAVLANGLARSDDGGQTWKRVAATAMSALLVADEPRTLYAGPIPSCYKGTGLDVPVSRSTDGGATWQAFKGSEGIRPVAAHPTKAGTVYGISCRGLNISRDGGQTWQNSGATKGWDITNLLPVPGRQLRFLAVLTSEGGTSRLAWFNEDGLLTQDAGTSAGQSGGGLQFWGTGALAMAATSGSASPALYLADATGVRRSDDSGATWTLWQDGLADVALAHDPLKDGMTQAELQKGYGLLAITVDPADANSLFLGTVRGLYRSADGGKHWVKADIAVLNDQRVTSLQWDPARSGVLYAGTAQGVYEVK